MEKQSKPPLRETFAGLVYDMFKAAGMAISQPNQERVESVAPRFAEAVKREAREAALVLAKRLQEATLEGFKRFSEDFDTMKNEVGELRNEVKRLAAENKELRNQFDSGRFPSNLSKSDHNSGAQ